MHLYKTTTQSREQWQTFFCESSSLNLWGSLSEEFSSETNQVTETPLWDQLKWRHSRMAANLADRRLHNISSEGVCFQSVLDSAHHHSNLVYFLPSPTLAPHKSQLMPLLLAGRQPQDGRSKRARWGGFLKNAHLFQVAADGLSTFSAQQIHFYFHNVIYRCLVHKWTTFRVFVWLCDAACYTMCKHIYSWAVKTEVCIVFMCKAASQKGCASSRSFKPHYWLFRAAFQSCDLWDTTICASSKIRCEMNSN